MKCSKFKQSNIQYHTHYSNTKTNTNISPIIKSLSNDKHHLFNNKKINKLQSSQNSISSDALTPYFYFQKLNGNSTRVIDDNNSHNNRKPLNFSSNKIITKEIAMLKNHQSNGVEALINQTIDFTPIPNSTQFGLSILDCGSTYHFKKKVERTNKAIAKAKATQPLYITTSDKDKSDLIATTESIVGFKYGGDVKIKANKAKCVNSKSLSESKDNKVNKDNDIKVEKSKKEIIIKSSSSNNKRNDQNYNKADTDEIKEQEQLGTNKLFDNDKKEAVVHDSSAINKINENNSDRILNYQQNPYTIRLCSNLRNNNENDNNNNNFRTSPSNKTEIEFTPELKVETNVNIAQGNNPNEIKLNDVIYHQEIIRNDGKKTSGFRTDSGLIANKINYNEEEDNNIQETFLQENIKLIQVYESEPIYTLNDIWYKNNANKDKITQKFSAFIQKYMIDSSSSASISSDSFSDYRTLQINKDFDEITKIKSQILNIHQYYSNQIYKIQYEMKKIDEKKPKMDESLMSKASSSSLTLFSKQDKIRLIMEKLDHLDESLSQKERNYKMTVNTLLKHLQEASKNCPNASNNETLIKEANDFLNDDENLFKLRRKEMTNLATGNEILQLPQDNRSRSLLTELENFKKEESLYKFEIPQKYQTMHLVKCVKEQAIKGKLVRFYDNSAIDIMDKKKTIKRLFPDGYEIWYYNNKDIQLKLSNGRLYFFYNKNKSFEFRFLNDNFTVYKFQSGQYEKHYFDNSTSIKFTDGSYRITRPNGEELIQFPDGAIHYSDPKGKR